MIERNFITAGKSVFTLAIPDVFAAQHDTATHYTYRVERREASDRWRETYFVQLLTGPDNTSDYSYLGILDPQSGTVRVTAKSCAGEDSWAVRLLRRVLACLWVGQGERIEAAGFHLHHEGRCGRCGRRLTVPESIESGIGPECARQLIGAA
jgi:hypothetical protein